MFNTEVMLNLMIHIYVSLYFSKLFLIFMIDVLFVMLTSFSKNIFAYLWFHKWYDYFCETIFFSTNLIVYSSLVRRYFIIQTIYFSFILFFATISKNNSNKILIDSYCYIVPVKTNRFVFNLNIILMLIVFDLNEIIFTL